VLGCCCNRSRFDSDQGTDSMGAPLLDHDHIQQMWQQQCQHIACIQDPAGVSLYTKTGSLVKGGGLQEGVNLVIANKLWLDKGDSLPIPSAYEGSGDISFVPLITVIDIYKYLLDFLQYDHTTLRNYYKMEGYTTFQDGFVLNVQGVRLPCHYVTIKATVCWLTV